MLVWFIAKLFLAALPSAYAADVLEALQEGDNFLTTGDARGAIKAYSSAIELDPDNKLGYTKRAAAHTAVGSIQAAIRDYARALEIEPSSSAIRTQRGNLYLRMCKFEEAQADFVRVLEQKPDNEKAASGKEKANAGNGHLTTAEALLQNGDNKAAVEALSRLHKISPDCSRARILSAQVYMEEGKYEESSWETSRVLKSEPGNVQALLIRAQSFYQLEEFDMTKRHLAEVITNYDPDNKEARDQFKKVKVLMKSLDSVRESIKQKKWSAAVGPIEKLLSDLSEAHQATRREMSIAFVRALHHLDRKADNIIKYAEEILDEEYDEDVFVAYVETLLKLEQFEQASRVMHEHLEGLGRIPMRIHQLGQRVEKLLKKSKKKDYYKILGVSAGLDPQSLKKVYRKLAVQYHPDKVGGDKEKAEANFADINEAYEVLSDPEKRRLWEEGEDPFHEDPHQQRPNFHFHRQGHHTFHFSGF